MDTELRELLNHSSFSQSTVREIIPLLPEADEALNAWIAELLTNGDSLAFLLVTTAALEAGRVVDAEHLVRGMPMTNDASRLGNFVFQMKGDVMGALLKAMKFVGGMPEGVYSGALLIMVLWCERHGQPLPEAFVALARTLSRTQSSNPEACAHLCVAAFKAGDEGLLTLVRKNRAETMKLMTPEWIQMILDFYFKIFDGPAINLVPVIQTSNSGYRQPLRRAVEKHHRNEPCPCGSGLKYKRCCAEKDQDRLAQSSDVAGRTSAELSADPTVGLTAARLKILAAYDLARIDVRQVPETLRTPYFHAIVNSRVWERVGEYFEFMDWNEERRNEWHFAMKTIVQAQDKEIAERLLAAHEGHEPVEHLHPGIRQLITLGDPAAELHVLEEMANELLRWSDPPQMSRYGAGIAWSPRTALGILICRSLIPILPMKLASDLHLHLLLARDRLNLPPEDPFDDVIEKRLAEETHDEGKDATALRAARKHLEAKAAEVRHLRDEIERQRHELERIEKQQKKSTEAPKRTPSQPPPIDEAELKEMRRKLSALKTTLTERSEERTTLRHTLQKAQQELVALRQGQAAPSPEPAADDEAAHYLPEQPVGNQPLRLIDFPHKFRETLEDLPRTAARAALTMIGRLAAGESEAFVGVVQLKAVHGILRQRIGLDHRLLFRLLPERVQVIDLINRRDLDRRIKALRSSS